MVLTHNPTDTREQALNCVEILLNKRLLLDATISEKNTYSKKTKPLVSWDQRQMYL